MNRHNIPKLVTVKTGDSFKAHEVTGQAGMAMPLHYSTREAIVIVQEGSAILNIDGQKVRLERNDSYIIPARKNHSLLLETEFKSLVIMALDSTIEFAK